MNRDSALAPRNVRTFAVLAALLPFGAAFADTPPDDDEWRIVLGAGVGSRPLFPGSDKTETQALPIVNASRGNFFVGRAPGMPGLGVGYDLFRTDHFRVGAALSAMPTKLRDKDDADEDPRLRGLGDIDGTAYAGFYAVYARDWFELSGGVATDAAGKDHGTVATFDATVNLDPTDRLRLSFGPGVSWSNAKRNRTFFGVDAAQAAATGLAPYTPDAGVSDVHFSLGATYRLGEHWSLGVRATAARLQGDAKDSPIVLDENQNTFGLFAAYRY